MSNYSKLATTLALAALVSFVGCRKEPAPLPPPVNPPAPPANPADQPAGEKTAEQGKAADEVNAAEKTQTAADDKAKIEAALASLSADDRALALKQKICPVSDEPLGLMGTPIKVEVAGQEVFICCEHCEEPLIKEQDKYLAKLGLTPAADAGPK
jgi:hypothetical protein